MAIKNLVPFPPQAYLIGAQKAGTTSLAFLLQQHHKIALSIPKETHFFSTEFARGLDWYRDKFDFTSDQILLDASTSYTMANLDCTYDTGIRVNVAQRIQKLRPDAKFIYILRDPVERTISAYWHNVRFASERRPLREAIMHNPSYIWPGQYYRQIEPYLEHFEDRAIFVLSLSKLEQDPNSVALAAIKFLELPKPKTELHLKKPKNKGFQLTIIGNAVRRTLGSDDAFFRFVRMARKTAPTSIHDLARRLLVTDVGTVSMEDRNWLREFFIEDVESITKHYGINLFEHSAGC